VTRNDKSFKESVSDLVMDLKQ